MLRWFGGKRKSTRSVKLHALGKSDRSRARINANIISSREGICFEPLEERTLLTATPDIAFPSFPDVVDVGFSTAAATDGYTPANIRRAMASVRPRSAVRRSWERTKRSPSSINSTTRAFSAICRHSARKFGLPAPNATSGPSFTFNQLGVSTTGVGVAANTITPLPSLSAPTEDGADWAAETALDVESAHASGAKRHNRSG